MRRCWSLNSCVGTSTHVCALLTSAHLLLEKRQHWALLFSLGFPSSVDVAHSYSCSLIHANALLLTLLPYISPNTSPLPVLLPPPLLSILFLADSFIHKWYIGGYPLSMPDACWLFSDRSLPLAMAQIKYVALFIFPPTHSLSFPHLVSNIHPICVVSWANYTRI